MKRHYLFLVICTLVNLSAIGQHRIDSSYYSYSKEEFYKLTLIYQHIDILQPDYELLDATIFYETNEARIQEKIPPFRYSKALHNAAILHSNSMIDLDFCSHFNNVNTYYYFPLDRIRDFDQKVPIIGENIAEYPLMDSPSLYCPERLPDGDFSFYNCKTHKPLVIYTYLAYARKVVENWMNSPPHRRNILNTDFQNMGCAARFSKNPFKERRLPFSRMTQNFGGFFK